MISVVIPAYNEEKTLGATLAALTRQTYALPFEVMVVNNNSTDQTTAVAKRYADRLDIRVIDEPRKGRGVARHTGFMASRGDIIFSLDADACPPPDWLATFAHIMEDPAVPAVTGTCYINDLPPVKNFIFNVIQPTVTIVYRWLFRHYWLAGFSAAVRREVYVAAGGFNPALNALEDADLGYKVQQLGKIRFNGRVPVLVSGRRFRDSLGKGLWSYVVLLYHYKYGQREAIHLNDQR